MVRLRTKEKFNSKSIASKTRNLVYIAICTSLICICSWITIPGTIPFTLHVLVRITVSSLTPVS